MPTRFQTGTGGVIFHVLNRGARRLRLFDSPDDYTAFMQVLVDAEKHAAIRLLCFSAMPNHWHMVVWPVGDGELSRYMQWVTRTHAQRWHLAHRSVGTGAVYQGRFHAFPVQSDGHFLTVCRYAERNPVRAGLVRRAEEWRWSSAWPASGLDPRPTLAGWPVPRPMDWSRLLSETVTEDRLEELRGCVRKQVPFGEPTWSQRTAEDLRLRAGCRGVGRPPGRQHARETPEPPATGGRGCSL